MTIITSGELTDLYNQRTFRANGSTVTLKKVSETDWMLIGDLAEGDSEGFPAPVGDFVIKTTNGVVAGIRGPGEVPGTDIYMGEDGSIGGGSQLEEVLSWPEEKPVWLEGDGVMFYGSDYLIKVPDTLPTWITDMTDMFAYCSSFNQDLSGWDTSNVTNMSTVFYDCPNFDQDLSGWDTSKVTTMYSMFGGCPSFNQDISGWDTSNVTGMIGMFEGCSSFNQDLSGWCVSNISSEPSRFSDDTPSWTLPKPVWGTCPSQGLAPGEEFEGGYFVGVSFDGDYNLFVSKGEIGSYKFSESDYAPYTSADSETDGYYNTQQILNTISSYAFPAAQACDEHFSDGFGGWFLPSRYELGLLRDNSSQIPLVLPARAWTSEDRTGERSLTFYFDAGSTGTAYKSNTFPVYAFRRVLR